MECDCLDYCGDDPRLKDGRVDRCEAWKVRDKKEAAAREERARIHGIVNTLAVSAIANGTATVSAKDMNDIQRLINNKS
ncbi:MAG: hypothetical protein KKD65_16505 [Gammaproteobacteria bacterium]|nr:hypothetical protein [Gammaproteobacteria bacterium]